MRDPISHLLFRCLSPGFLLLAASVSHANPALLEKHCRECHNEEKNKGDFELRFLGDKPTQDNIDYWFSALDLVEAEEMPPEDESKLSAPERKKLIAYIEKAIADFDVSSVTKAAPLPRRLNNREFERSIADVLGIEDVGTHQPTDRLIGDSRYHGFDTHSETLGFSRFHLEQYVDAIRKIVDATILTGPQPETKRYEIDPENMVREVLNQNSGRIGGRGKDGHFDFLDPRLGAWLDGFEEAPATGRYRIRIFCTGKDRLTYDSEHTGVYSGDPIQLSVHLGDRIRTFNLPDDERFEITLDDWIAEGTRLILRNPTDGLRQRGNGNFKFQYAIAADHYKKYRPEDYVEFVESRRNNPNLPRSKSHRPDRWHNWVGRWEGPRPRVYRVEIEGPIHDSWPTQRQVALLGDNPSVKNAETILKPIAARAWRRPVKNGELDGILALVRDRAESTGDEVEALKEGLVGIFSSPAFLLINTGDMPESHRFVSKLSYFLEGTTSPGAWKKQIREGGFPDFASVKAVVEESLSNGRAVGLTRGFPYSWLELADINFMAPDPDQYRFYHRKRVSEDMVNEVLAFFRHAVDTNMPIPEFLSADYSFINQDLARIYGVADSVPLDSKLRRFTFTDGRRGGLLGMAAFLTSTADSLGTSPIHRAVYVMENFLGIHPTPPPPDVPIAEPDVRKAKTIKEILEAHTSDKTCASCHETIDPWGYAFENYDPTGAWRDEYVVPVAIERTGDEDSDGAVEVVYQKETLPVDASATFRSGASYDDITGLREHILNDINRDRFVRCFIVKLLTYANGVEPKGTDFIEVDRILDTSKLHEYRIVETIAAVIDSPLFRER
ncbi:MAG: DUF1588 domain-containing protein [Verrucomicrobiales bacterium]|nr:DUF1588 domain-containing protein [Verrucomicrobiales bacterium]